MSSRGSKKNKGRQQVSGDLPPRQMTPKEKEEFAAQLADMSILPVTYQDINDLYARHSMAPHFSLRKETFRRIEKATTRPLVCYVTKTHSVPPGIPVGIDASDLVGFSDLCRTIPEKAIDVFIVSNGGSAEATERIVQLLREHYESVRFIVPANAYSAATLMCFSGDVIIMDDVSTLGPIDPQIDGIPARAILRSFEGIEKRIKQEGIEVLAPYIPLLQKFNLSIIEICNSAERLSRELAEKWLTQYMFRDVRAADSKKAAALVRTNVDFFVNYDVHKSHSRSIDRHKARDMGLEVAFAEEVGPEFRNLVRSLYNQYEYGFDKTGFFKMFENARGINWGRQTQLVSVHAPLVGLPGTQGGPVQPGPPRPTS